MTVRAVVAALIKRSLEGFLVVAAIDTTRLEWPATRLGFLNHCDIFLLPRGGQVGRGVLLRHCHADCIHLRRRNVVGIVEYGLLGRCGR